MITTTHPTISLDKATQILSAMSDPTRLRLLSLIAHNGEICVCDLIDITELPQPKVSRHLATLRHAGLVNDRRDGQWMYYSLAPAESDYHKSLLSLLKKAYETVPELKDDLTRLASCSCCNLSSKMVEIELPKKKK